MMQSIYNFLRVTRIFLDGLILRCPHCHAGKMFHRFTMYTVCPICDTPFENAAGEITGGMGINTVVTCALMVTLAVIFAFTPAIPLAQVIGVLVAVGVAFPIAFYRSSRGLWVSFLYWTGNNTERDIHTP
jgi:uncharacterized protein (DUF983 family)